MQIRRLLTALAGLLLLAICLIGMSALAFPGYLASLTVGFLGIFLMVSATAGMPTDNISDHP